jgi:hypothetical protein
VSGRKVWGPVGRAPWSTSGTHARIPLWGVGVLDNFQTGKADNADNADKPVKPWKEKSGHLTRPCVFHSSVFSGGPVQSEAVLVGAEEAFVRLALLG